jgi:very-short-patch-repair endonuclease
MTQTMQAINRITLAVSAKALEKRLVSAKALEKRLFKHVLQSFEVSYGDTQEEYGFMRASPDLRAIDYLRERTIMLSEKTADRLTGDLKYQLMEGMKGMESITEIKQRLKPIFDDMKDYELERLARNEVMDALNEGRMEAARDDGDTRYKVWQAALKDARTAALKDARTADDSKRLAGQIQLLEEQFVDPKTGKQCDHAPNRPNCLYNSPLIYTIDGWRSLAQIDVGDLVLTHKGRFRPVTQTHQNPSCDPAYKIVLSWDGHPDTVQQRKLMSLMVTPEHPFMTDRGWVEAQHLNQNDKIRVLADRCKNCDALYPVVPNGTGDKNYYRYCSSRCGRSHTAKDQWANTDMREVIASKISTSMKEQYESGERSKERSPEHLKVLIDAGTKALKSPEVQAKNWIYKPKEETAEIRDAIRMGTAKWRKENPDLWDKARARMSTSRIELHEAHPELHPNYIMAQKGFESSLERMMREELENRDITFSVQEHIDKYWVDFVIPDHKIAIECDGEYWHQDITKDANRDDVIKSYGWDVLHFTGKQIVDDVVACVDSIERLMKNHDGEYQFMWLPIKTIEVVAPGKTASMTRNLSVADDESFVARSFVVHNCRCGIIFLEELPDNIIHRGELIYHPLYAYK